LRGTVVIVAVLAALLAAPAALAGRASEPAPRGPGLLELGAYGHALIQLRRDVAGPPGATLVSRRLNVWRLPRRDAMRALPSLLAARTVEHVEPDRELELLAAQADELSEFEWWRPRVGADRATPPGPGKALTVIDSGLDVSHPEFAGRANTALMNPQRFDESDGEFHGTAVSSVAAAPENGVGVVGVYPQAVLRMWDAGAPLVSRVIQGLEAAMDAGPGVINISLGFSFDDLLEKAILQAVGTGSLVVAAAGNDREQGSPATFPANLNHVLTVAATDENDQPTAFSNASLGVDLAAPGQNIPAAIAFSGWEYVDGTSFSSPLVAGAAAWVWTARPTLDNTQLFDLIRWTARDVGRQGFDPDTGFGVLDIPSALSAAAPATDGQEPNDDIEHIKANGLFRNAARPLTAAGRPRATVNARLDATEDPEDVYRVWVPANRVVRATVTTNTDVDVDLWRSTTRSVLARGAERRRFLITTSAKRGRVAERVLVRNRTRRGFFVYLDVYLRENGPGDADYRATIATARR
jgi:hypothetical protein